MLRDGNAPEEASCGPDFVTDECQWWRRDWRVLEQEK